MRQQVFHRNLTRVFSSRVKVEEDTITQYLIQIQSSLLLLRDQYLDALSATSDNIPST